MIPITVKRLNLVWFALLVATACTLFAGEFWRDDDHAGAIVGALGALTLYKGRLIALDYMGLRGTSRLWRAILLGWLLSVLGLVGLAWWLGR